MTPIYAGTYQDTLTKAQTALKANAGPQMAVLLSTDAFSLIDDDLIVPFDTLATSAEDKAWLRSFYPAFLKNGADRRPYLGRAVPAFDDRAVTGTRPRSRRPGWTRSVPPATWAGACGVRAEADQASKRRQWTRWGVQIPASGFPYWLFQALATEAGGTLANADGTETDFASPRCVEALRYWIDLTAKYRAHPPGIVDWGTTPRDFLEQKVAMIWTTTGNLSNIRSQCEIPVRRRDAAGRQAARQPDRRRQFLSVQDRRRQPQREARLRFLRWISSPERAAQWGIDTGYVATRPDAWETPAMQEYVAGFPGRRGRARPVAVRGRRAVDARQPARDPGAERRAAGGAARTQGARARRWTEAQATATQLLRPFH